MRHLFVLQVGEILPYQGLACVPGDDGVVGAMDVEMR